jgi:hypothetical protein
MNYVKKKNYILIDSRDRNISIHPEPNTYVLKLNDIVKNIFSVKLVYALYPKHGNEFYTNVHIEEFAPNAVSNNRYLMESFTQIPMMNYYNEYKSELSDKIGKYFELPIPKLTQLTIKFINYGGELAIMGEHFLKFEIEHLIYDGPPEMNKLTLTNIFNLRGKYNKKDLNRAYKRLRSKAATQEDIDKIKTEYLRMYDNMDEVI